MGGRHKRRRSDPSRDGERDHYRASTRVRSHVASGSSDDDDDGRDSMHYSFRVGELLKSRYRTLSLLGTGTFGKVILCHDERSERDVAIKVVRAIYKYSSEATVEARILADVLERARAQCRRIPIVELFDRFEHRGHVCLVFERLGHTLLEAVELARTPHEHGASSYLCLRTVQSVARSLFDALAFLHGLSLSHTDLKPENILFVDAPGTLAAKQLAAGNAVPHGAAGGLRDTPQQQPQQPPTVKLIDFGGATFANEHHSEIVCTRQYRPPEVTLGMRWGCEVDLWSSGCILAELYTGHVLFATHDEAEHLALMERCLGAIPRRMARAASERAQRRWFVQGVLHWPQIATDRKSERHVRESARLKDTIARDRPWTRAHDEFLSLLHRLLEYLPEHRITAREALLHPFLTMEIPPGVA
ncbi:hypothetical protein KFE25_009929 [Diacronema lutheri]|uniref:Protein kinase domain-containing protein n=1 Tax=Diacronema lutheri TaxID=2081491 RepID=A0A8J5X9Y4_DIALT|nr:hypothetical protein KFE25_009929 [Diacronema lutheri]